MLKQKRIKIRLLLILGVTIIFASSITPLIMMAVDNVRSLGGFAIKVGGHSIEKGSALLFLERVKAKASEYSETFTQAEKYASIFQAQMNSVMNMLPYYAYPNKKNIEYLTSLERNTINSIIRSKNKDNVNFWYWGGGKKLSKKAKNNLDCFSLYYPFIKKIGSQNKFFFSTWILYFPDKILLSYYNDHSDIPKMPNRMGLESYLNTYDYEDGKWTPIYRDVTGHTICTFSKFLFDSRKKYIGRIGIDVNIDKLISDVENYKMVKRKGLTDITTKKPIKSFSFILNDDLEIVNFPVEYYNIFGFNANNLSLNQDQSSVKFNESKYTEIVNLAKIMKKTDDGYTVLNFDNNGKYVVTFAHIKANKWTMGVVVPIEYLLEAVRETKAEISIITRDLMFALAIMAVMFFIVAVFLILVVFKEYLMNPIYNLTAGIAGVIKSSFKKRLDEDGAPEIVDLSKTFNKMTAELTMYMNGLKEEIEAREKTETELQTARKIQEALLPSTTKIFENRNFNLFAGVLPATFVSGDFYDYFFVSKNKLAFLIGDVSGQGVSSAFYMTIVRSIVRDTCQQESDDPADAVKKINKLLYQEYKVDMFVSLVLVYYDVLTGDIQYVNAGHPDILLVRSNGACKDIERNEGLILAFAENSEYISSSFKLKFNESLVLYSDGILETYNDDLLYFREDLIKLLNKNYLLSVETLCKEILNKIDVGKNEKRDDDFTLLIFRREHGGIKAAESRRIKTKH